MNQFILPARFLRYTGMQLLSGGNYDIDVDDLKNNTRYTGGYNEGSRTIKIFWEVLWLDKIFFFIDVIIEIYNKIQRLD